MGFLDRRQTLAKLLEMRAISELERERAFYEQDMMEKVLSGLDLSGMDFSEYCLITTNFSHSNLSGTNFSKSNLIGANFSDCNVEGINLEGANLHGLKIDPETAGKLLDGEREFQLSQKQIYYIAFGAVMYEPNEIAAVPFIDKNVRLDFLNRKARFFTICESLVNSVSPNDAKEIAELKASIVVEKQVLEYGDENFHQMQAKLAEEVKVYNKEHKIAGTAHIDPNKQYFVDEKGCVVSQSKVRDLDVPDFKKLNYVRSGVQEAIRSIFQ